MLSAHTEAKYLDEFTELKTIKYLIKPVSRNVLQNALQMAIDTHQ